jgi:hypothetical protein
MVGCTQPRDSLIAPDGSIGGIGDAATSDTAADLTDAGTVARIELDNTAHDYGPVVVGSVGADATFVLRNAGSMPSGTLATSLSAGASGFSVKTDECSGMILAGGSSCQIVVSLVPTAAGVLSTDLTVMATPGGAVAAHLTAMAIAPGTLQIAPATQDFGMVVENNGSATLTFTITNTGQEASGATTAAVSGSDATQFTINADGCTGQAVAATRTCQITVRFSPTSAGVKSAALTVSGTPGGAAVAQLTGTGITPSVLAISPGTHDFGAIQQGMTGTSQTFIVQNTGQATTGLLAALLAGADAGDFSISSNTCANQTLAANATCMLIVKFAPIAAGSKVATLSVTGSPGGSGVSQLTGTSLANPSLSVAPASKDFNSVTMGSSASASFVISNLGGVTTGVPAVAINGTDAAQFSIPAGGNGCTVALPANGTCMVSVRFAPTATGVKMGALAISATPGGSATTTLMGTGIAQGLIAITPTNQAFTSILQGTTGAPVSFTITNSGGSPTGALTASIVGTTEFQIAADTCSTMTLAAMATCTVSVEFAPGSPGPKSGTLEVTSTPGGTAAAALTGSGLAPASLVAVPTSFSFANTLVGGTSTTETFTITNSGGVAAGTATGVAALITGTNAADFHLTSTTCAGQLGAGASCMAVVAFAPASSGSKTASLNVSGTPGGTAAASLTGTAQTPAALTLAAATGSSNTFGNVVSGSAQNETFVVTNTGQQSSSAVTVNLTTAAGSGFTLLAPGTGDCVSGTTTLATSASCTIRVQFSSSGGGAATATLGVSASIGGTPPALALTATGVMQALLTITPTTSAFPATAPSAMSSTTTFTVTNMGGAPAGTTTGLAVSITGANSTEFGVNIVNTCTGTLAPGATCQVGVAFTPKTGGSKTASLNVSGTPGGTATATLSGTALTPAALTFAPATGSSTAFGNVPTGSSVTETFIVTNTGQQATMQVAVTLSPAGTGFGLVAPGTGDCVSGVTALSGGASCTVRVSFTPTGTGAATASVAVAAQPATAPPALTLTGTGVPASQLSISPTTASFPNTAVGTNSAPVTFTVTNNGTITSGTTTPFGISFPGSFGGVPVNNCPATLAPGASCTFQIIFIPQSAGLQTVTLTASANPGGTATATLTGTGVIVTHTVTVSETGSGTVTSTSAPTQTQQISCPSTCAVAYNPGDLVTLTASPAAGFVFSGWSGSCSGRSTCVVPTSADASVGATFVAASAVAKWVLNGTIDSTNSLPASTTASGVSAESLTRSAPLTPMVFANAFVTDNWPAGALDTGSFFDFGVTPSTSISYDSVRFSLYNNFDGAVSWQLRSSIDNFTSPLAQGSVASGIFGGGVPIVANVSALGNRTGTVTFRFYTFSNSGATSPLQRGFRGSAAGGTDLSVFGAVF